MNRQELIAKIKEKKEFSELPEKDVEFLVEKLEGKSDIEIIKQVRDELRKIYSVFGSGKLLNLNILNKKTPEEILKKHISTRERFDFYPELYEKIFEDFKEGASVIDLGAGINGLGFEFFPKNKVKEYFSVEAVGQLVSLVKEFFRKEKIKNAFSIQESLLNIEDIKKIIQKTKKPRIVFLFKVVDCLEMFEKNFSKKLLKEIFPLVDRIVVSFATRSLVSRKPFRVKRYWFENFIKEQDWKVLDDFELGNERYMVIEK